MAPALALLAGRIGKLAVSVALLVAMIASSVLVANPASAKAASGSSGASYGIGSALALHRGKHHHHHHKSHSRHH